VNPVPHMLGIFAKAPVPGRVKTRLAADIGEGPAAEWYARAIEAVFRTTDALSVPVQRVLFFDPPDAEASFADMEHVPDMRVPQTSGDLGARMHKAFGWCFAHGARAVALIGTDAPTLPASLIDAAWSGLERADVVLGPATDGGYYLIALHEPRPRLFSNMPWSTNVVLDATVARAEQAELRVHQLATWQDVDTAADLAALGAEWAPKPSK